MESLARFNSGYISGDAPSLDLSEKCVGKDSGSGIRTVEGDKKARHECLPKADPDNRCLHDRCQTTHLFSFT